MDIALFEKNKASNLAGDWGRQIMAKRARTSIIDKRPGDAQDRGRAAGKKHDIFLILMARGR